MSHGAITLIITGCDQYPGNCWIAVPFLGDSFQQFNDITNVPTFFFWSIAPPYEVVAFVLKSADYSLVLWHLFLFHYNSFTIVWFTVFNIRYSFNPLYSSTRMESIKVCSRSVTIVVLLLDWWFILPFDEIALADEELVEVELGEVGK